MSLSKVTINPLKQTELPLLISAANKEGWRSEPLSMMSCFFEPHQNGFFGAYIDAKLVGMVLAVKQGEKMGFISNFLVLKSYRSRGFGKALFEHAMGYLSGRVVMLDSVVDKLDMYIGAGFFKDVETHTFVFNVGTVTLALSHEHLSSYIDAKRFLAYDKSLATFERSSYMKCLLENDDVLFMNIDDGEKVHGYGLRFAYGDGVKVVLVSSDINDAMSLFFALVQTLEMHTPVYIDANEKEPMLQAITELLKMKRISSTVKMVHLA